MLTGAPGTWNYTASKTGYDSESWQDSVTVDVERHAFLQKVLVPDVTVLGIDVSHWQGDINWFEVDNAGYRFAFVKDTEGDHRLPQVIDAYCETNMIESRQAGMLMGAYHFAYPQFNDAEDEARFFVSVAGDYITEGYLRPVLDLEQGQELDTETLSTWVHEFMSIVESETGVSPLIYVTKSYAQFELNLSVNQYDLWIADWSCDTEAPPNVQDIGMWATQGWDFWQYWEPDNCGLNAVPGINGGVDLDLFNGSESDLQNFVIAACAIPVGQDAPDDNPQPFVDSFDLNGGKGNVGCPTSDVHRWGGGYIQDFEGGTEGNAGPGGIMLRDDTSTAYWVHGGVWQKYVSPGVGGATGFLGYPLTDEQEADISPNGTTGIVTEFEGGRIPWHRDDPDDPFANQAFETHGDIDDRYVLEGGSGGLLGFPISDEWS